MHLMGYCAIVRRANSVIDQNVVISLRFLMLQASGEMRVCDLRSPLVGFPTAQVGHWTS